MSSNRTRVLQIIKSVSEELAVDVPEVRFQNRANLATVRKSEGKVIISFNSDIESFEAEFLEMLAFYTLAKLNGKVDSEKFIQSKEYVSKKLDSTEKSLKDKPKPSASQHYIQSNEYIGIYWNLKEIYNKIFAEFRDIFEPVYGNNPPKLSWTKRPTYRIMAHYTFGENKVSISKSLDAPDVPELVLKYLMYHELLHGIVGRGLCKNRNLQLLHKPHNQRFKALESLFPEKEKAEALLKMISKHTEMKIKASKRSFNSAS
jgi:predicted metal-dependent hydrolase